MFPNFLPLQINQPKDPKAIASTALALTKDNQQSLSTIFFLPKERPQPGIGWSITTTSGEAEIALARHLVIEKVEQICLKIDRSRN
ncbi:hypothetical protein A4S05_02505 [Nostoc sp. KVJ20]|uniref:hypothetical protein n=1 Tax=Nostoc sp. KVJ20 TaxID=457944 RepID=UPI00083D9715|nr:hypothetical protein [Nostoc sp. KVJ20]ODH02543.1 hypothetical protein A4S05_02505 [Nostoc sp. KVJ20]